MLRRTLRSPVFHSVLLGVLLAVAVLLIRGPAASGEEAKRVVITGADVIQLKAAFTRTWNREPTLKELRGTTEKHIRQEVLYREALARGYDRDDIVIRRAMAVKMEYLADSQALQEPPDENEIQAYFALRRERYREPAVLSLRQVYVSTDVHGDRAGEKADAILEQLRRDDPEREELPELGDRLMLPNTIDQSSEIEVARRFGEEFAAVVSQLEPGSWQGPVLSGFGLHLVKVTDRQDSHLFELIAVRQRVLDDMRFESRDASRELLYQEIAQGYTIELDDSVRDLIEATEG